MSILKTVVSSMLSYFIKRAVREGRLGCSPKILIRWIPAEQFTKLLLPGCIVTISGKVVPMTLFRFTMIFIAQAAELEFWMEISLPGRSLTFRKTVQICRERRLARPNRHPKPLNNQKRV